MSCSIFDILNENEIEKIKNNLHLIVGQGDTVHFKNFRGTGVTRTIVLDYNDLEKLGWTPNMYTGRYHKEEE